LAAETTDSILAYSANMRAHANTCATSSIAPLAQSQATRRKTADERRFKGG
jgi:hypothetical protein